MAIIYIGASKDIRLTEKLLFNITCRRQIGLFSAIDTNYTIWASNVNVVSKVKGGALFAQIGLKYRIK